MRSRPPPEWKEHTMRDRAQSTGLFRNRTSLRRGLSGSAVFGTLRRHFPLGAYAMVWCGPGYLTRPGEGSATYRRVRSPLGWNDRASRGGAQNRLRPPPDDLVVAPHPLPQGPRHRGREELGGRSRRRAAGARWRAGGGSLWGGQQNGLTQRSGAPRPAGGGSGVAPGWERPGAPGWSAGPGERSGAALGSPPSVVPPPY